MENRTPLLRRLNGRPQACDQCRSRKVACDHDQPVCSRCKKRKQRCTYTISESRPKRSQPQGEISPTSSPTPTLLPLASGYLGFTSHTTVFEETRNSLALVQRPAPEASSAQVQAQIIEMPLPLREMYRFVLRNIPQPNDVLYHRGGCPGKDDWITISLQSTFRALDEWLGERREDSQLDRIADRINRSTARPLKNDHDNSAEWLDQFSGPAMRWESLGLIWTYWDGLSGANCQVAVKCLGYCIELAQFLTTGNDLMLYLCYRRSTVQSLITGDASLLCWRYHGDTVSLMTFLGVHVGPDDPGYTPSLCSESQRRLAARVFIVDKVLVSFTGRPPLISRRYASMPPPLDICDADLLSDHETLNRAVKNLDENGWSKNGGLHSATLIRARLKIAIIKDEILEIALGSNPSADLGTLRDAIRREEILVAQFPQILRYRPEDLDNQDGDAEIVYSRILVWLEHLQNLFFAERLSLRLGHTDHSHLLIISFEMVSLTLFFWTNQDRFARFRQNFEWLLMAYAAPGGGILCLELLRPTFHGIHPQCPTLSRSAIIQKLSLLVGFLDWVRSPAPNAALCADCKAVIQGTLDYNLNVPLGEGRDLETLDWGVPMQLDFNFDLLNTFDWLQTD